jgi:hypothetical protein
MAQLTHAVTKSGKAAHDELLMLYRNGVADALDSFNYTVSVYSQQQVDRIDQENGLLFILIISMF